MKSLREELQDLTKEEDVGKHPALLRNLATRHPNSIVVLNSPHAIDRYTCLVHAFDFVERPEYADVATFGWGQYFASPDFATWIMEQRGLKEISQAAAVVGDLIFYFRDGRFRHAGVVRARGRIQSKWGTGHLYEHPVFEVPESYGAEVRYFKHVPFDDGITLLRQYAEARMRAP